MRLVFLCEYINCTVDKTAGTDTGHTACTNIIDITNYTAIIIIKKNNNHNINNNNILILFINGY